MTTGWICPRCQRVHAPHVAGCDCVPPAKTERYTVPWPNWRDDSTNTPPIPLPTIYVAFPGYNAAQEFKGE